MLYESAKEFILDKLTNELPPHLTYHSIDHIRDVYNSAGELALLEGVTGEDLKLLLTAVLFHDSGFTLSPKAHEDLGCQIAQKYLPGFEYTQEQITRICGMIMATMIPQSPNNLLEEIICDADLDYLGRDDFEKVGTLLYRELAANGIVSNENDWNKLQVDFLSRHHYFTRSAIAIREAKKEEHLNHLKSIIK
jgi:uncharacterized protein